MPTESSYYSDAYSCVVNKSSLGDIPAAQRKTSQETVRPRLNRATTMPSSYHYENGMPVEVFSSYYGSHDTFQNTATAPTSPSASSTSGSLLSSSTDDNEFMKAFGSADKTDPKPANSMARSPNQTKSPHSSLDPKVARPPNAWILYRSKKLAEFKESNPKMYSGKGATRSKADRGMRPTQASFSKQIAGMWAAEPPSVKEYYHSEASLRSMVHAIENPGYRFNPNKKRAEKDKVKRERSKSGSPLRTSIPLSISTPLANASPSAQTSSYYSPVAGTSPAFHMDQSSPWRQQELKWALTPPAFTTSLSNSGQSENSPLDSRYAQERRPSLKAQWEAIFPNEGSENAPRASPCSSSFSSSYTGGDAISPLWGMSLLPSLSVSEPMYSNHSSVQNGVSGGFPMDLASGMCTPAPSDAVTSPVQYAFVPPALPVPSMQSTTDYAYWSPEPGTASSLAPINPGYATPSITPASPAFSNSPVSQLGQHTVSDLPNWWAYRHVKVKPDEMEGIPLEDLLKSFDENKSFQSV